tara:strand:- start:4985 stop:5746 length:762 start_codon:yes stop_codon:yes gene_type:complete
MNKKQLEAKKKYYNSFKNSVDYIQEYKNVISEKDCKKIIKLQKKLEKDGLCFEGRTGTDLEKEEETIVNKNYKESYDVQLNQLDDYLETNTKEIYDINLLYKILNPYIADYVLKVGLMSIAYIGVGLDSFNKKRREDKDFFEDTKDLKSNIALSQLYLRRYPKKTGGYHLAHCDEGPRALSRCVAGILYLNTIKNGGETKFPVLGREIEAKEGKLVLFPPYYTHIHYGEVSPDEDRFVLVMHINYTNLEGKIL